jgi:hypothetical protein
MMACRVGVHGSVDTAWTVILADRGREAEWLREVAEMFSRDELTPGVTYRYDDEWRTVSVCMTEGEYEEWPIVSGRELWFETEEAWGRQTLGVVE